MKTTSEILDIVRQLREMGATGVTITVDGGVSAQFGVSKPAVVGPSELTKPVERKKHPSKTQDPPPTAEARAQWRDKIVEMASHGT